MTPRTRSTTKARRRRHAVPPPLLLALASTVMEGSEVYRGRSVPGITVGDAAARRLIARGVPFERDDVVAAATRVGHGSAFVKDALHEYDVSKDALELASCGYVEAGINLGMALMYHLMRDSRGGGAK